MARRILGLFAVLALVAAACSSAGASQDSTTTLAPTTTAAPTTTTAPTTVPEDTGFPVTIEAPNGPVTIEERPERIVSLSPTSTEVLYAVGAGSQIVAVDDQSNYPAEAPTSDLTGFDPNLEAIAAYDADLVIVMYDPGDVIAGLEAIGIPVLEHPAAATLDDTYVQIEQIGAATGHIGEAGELVAAMRSDIDAATSRAQTSGETYYHEVSPELYSLTSATFAGALYAMFGLENIADAADPDGWGYPQLSAEHVLAEDPAIIFLADTKCCGQSVAAIGERPGWDALTAVEQGAIVELDDDVASRWGPRVVDFVEAIAMAVEENA
ncbi:MAG: ABC transporter substrate-binding protein [Actinomycetota bacterium]